MVVLGFYINDAEPVPRAQGGFLSRHSYLYVVASSALEALLRETDETRGWEDYYHGLYGDETPAWARNRAQLEALIALCRERGIALRILMIPELHSPAQDYPFEAVHARIAEIARAGGVPVVEVRERMAGIEPRSLWVSPGDAHPNEEAHRIMAEGLFEALRDPASPAHLPIE